MLVQKMTFLCKPLSSWSMQLLVNATIGQEALSSVEGSSRYNQIGMTLRDKELTTFCIPKSIYHYKAMPFKL